jgi:peroxiredoxin
MNFDSEVLKNNVDHRSFEEMENIPLCDSLVIATSSFNHKEVLLKLFPFLKTSGCFSIYAISLEVNENKIKNLAFG